MATDFDVAIVGAGPAGSWAAFRLAARGARVALIDGSHPREKPCGGGLSARAIDLLQPVASSLPPAVTTSTADFATSGRRASVQLRRMQAGVPPLMVAARRDFDAALLQAARAAGAEHVPRRVIGFERRNGGWTIDTDTRRLRAGWLVGADGANSLVRRRVRTAFSRNDLSIASGYYVEGRTGTSIDIEFSDSPPGYLWAFPRPDHLAVGICAQADETTSGELLAAARAWIDQHAPAPNVALRRYSWPIPSLDERSLKAERASGDRWMLAGDAAGLVDPITREGIFFALQSGEFAAHSLLGQTAAATYSRLLRSHIYPELARAARMKGKFFGASFKTLLVGALGRSDRISAIMADLVAGRQTYRGLRRRLLLSGELRLALAYLRLTMDGR